ncbi:MAG: hypothetical protein RIS70_2131 [Planctomycetota bacterium]
MLRSIDCLHPVEQRYSQQEPQRTSSTRPGWLLSGLPHAANAILLAVSLLAVGSAVRAADSSKESFENLGRQYAGNVRPALQQFCLQCHSTEKKEGELDLERFDSFASVRRDAKVWQKVAEMLDNGEMPPKESKQPTAEQRKQLRSWVGQYLDAEAYANAGDPGPVLLRRLSNSEYTLTLRDLTGVASLDPAREFPVDSAAGEGFTNTGNALVMSPALLGKYLDAAKSVAEHAVLLPEGFRFSPATTRRDWTNETLSRIRDFYRQFSDEAGGTQVNLQGIVFDTNSGGRLALDRYLTATLEERDALRTGKKTVAVVAQERRLNRKYLGLLWDALQGREPSLLLDGLRSEWKNAKPADVPQLVTSIARWQQALWRFTSVGHIGKVGGPKAWQEPVSPLQGRQDLRVKLAAEPGQEEIVLYLVTGDAGDGNDGDFVVWEKPRLVAQGREDLSLRDVQALSRQLTTHRDAVFASTAKCLTAAAEASSMPGEIDLASLANKHSVDQAILAAWFDYLGISHGNAAKIESHLTQKNQSNAGYDFVKGWGPPETPNVAANASDQAVRIPGNLKAHGVAMHPSPTLNIVAGWQSPISGMLRVEAKVQHAHPECGNGVTWLLEVRRGNTRQRLAAGVSQGAKEIAVGPFENLPIRQGDIVSLIIGPRDGNHACDLTAVDLTLRSGDRTWDLAKDVSPDLLAGNPHADQFGNAGVWHFYTEPVSGAAGHVIPPDSLLAKWQSSSDTQEKQQLAVTIEKFLLSGPAANSDANKKDSPDAALRRQLTSISGPLFSSWRKQIAGKAAKDAPATPGAGSEKTKPETAQAKVWGIDPEQFGRHPDGSAIDPASLCVRAPAVIEVHLPADLADGCELVAGASLHAATAANGSAQVRVLTTKPDAASGLVASETKETQANGPWTSNQRGVAHGTPILVNDNSPARKRLERALEEYRNLFPIALCYTKIVPVDEVVTLTLFYREDDQLQRLMLDEQQTAELNRLWDELHFISYDALTLVDAFAQLMEYATQDADPKVFEPLRKPIHDRADAFRRRLEECEPAQVESLIAFTSQAYRRPLTEAESQGLRQLYADLRREELPHDDAWRLMLARILVSPAFLYRIEKPGQGDAHQPVSAHELATRLSYFLWSSQPDDELRQMAASGKLLGTEQLLAQTRRMLHDPRSRRLATEFACQWLHIYDFDRLDEKSERHFPSFAGLRGAMYEESILFFADLFQRNGRVIDILDADYTFLNEPLAKHYGIPNVAGAEWRRVDGVKQHSRGGILGQATTLAKQSGASRTSPILRGNWISEVLLGERLPRPPKGVPQLPEDETATEGLTVRQLVEKHSSDPKCAVCHVRVDPLGFALESFDAIGGRREKDLGNRPIDTATTTMDGSKIDGLPGLRDYLLTVRRDAFMRQFCKKLLGYALGRSIQLSDEPLLAEMQKVLKANDYHIEPLMETIVSSSQFRHIRGRDAASEE